MNSTILSSELAILRKLKAKVHVPVFDTYLEISKVQAEEILQQNHKEGGASLGLSVADDYSWAYLEEKY